MSNLLLPKFNGTGNPHGYIYKLERYMNAQEIHGRYRGDYLIGTLTGSAAIWLESLGDLQGFSYEELKAKLLDHYKEEAASTV